ncbi:glycosyltransferase involved in cell wall biosynthesis [Dysgonomonadaceae bacterium PH5-43]|nr:glycosyltransferase involved in cell wall biosynthesis [Dysgonomonadaceae bacterium PH5-43]
MKIVALHTDFRVYWPARLKQLSLDLAIRGDELIVIEIAGKGSPYAFSEKVNSDSINWVCLFPDEKIEDVVPAIAKKRVVEKLDEIKPEVVLSGAIAFTSGAAAVYWAKKNNKSVVIFDDSKLENVKRNVIVNLVKKIIYSNVDAILCPTEDWLDTYTFWGFESSAVFFGVDVVDNSFWGKKVNPIDNPDRYILSVGRQIQRKNFHTIISAFIKFYNKSSNPDLKLLLIGEGPERDGLELLSEELKNKIIFLPFQTPVELRRIYQNATAFVLASYYEQWGLVINEAMAAVLPIIASKQLGCTNSLVHNNENGFVFDANNETELVDIFLKISSLTDEDLDKMGSMSKTIISEWGLDRFSSGAIAAIDYSIKNKKNNKSLFSKVLLSKWTGRYNQG